MHAVAASVQVTATRGTVHNVKPQQNVPPADAFDNLLAELEADPVAARQLGEGRKWVREAFYADRPTLASLRLAIGLSQKQMGKQIGLKQPHVARLEAGLQEPKLGLAKSLAVALGVSLDALYEAWHNSRQDCEAREQA